MVYWNNQARASSPTPHARALHLKGATEVAKDGTKKKFTHDDAVNVLSELGYSEKDFPADAVAHGMNEETDHNDVTGGDPVKIAEIAIAHLKERPDYYDKLKQVENNDEIPFDISDDDFISLENLNWKEEDHPRDNDGKFTDTGESSISFIAGDASKNMRFSLSKIEETGVTAQIGNHEKFKNTPATVPAYVYEGKVYINPNAWEFWKDPETLMKKNFEMGQLSSSNPLHVIYHEIGHLKYKTRLSRFDSGDQGSVRKIVSARAAKNPNEFLAETYAAMQDGKKYGPLIMDMFEKYSSIKNQVENSKPFPRFFYCRHMQPGLAGYAKERILVDADAIKRMLPSLSGKPIYINHQTVELDTMKEKAVGYIAESFWNELDGWAWAKMLLIDEEAQVAAQAGWSVSNAYIPTDWGGGGTCNNVEYDRSITNGDFTHLALVQDPRYEEAKIFSPDEFKNYQEGKRQQLAELKNSKTNEKKGSAMSFNLFKREKKAVSTIDADTLVEITNDKGETVEVSVQDMIAAVQNAKMKKNEADHEAAESKAKEAKEEEKLNENTEVSVGEEKMTLKELMNRYGSVKANEAESKADEKKEETKENSKGSDSEKKPDHFSEISNANRRVETVSTVDTLTNKVQRGKNRYGSAK